MGRKSTDKERKKLSPKMQAWLKDLLPLIQEKNLKEMSMDELAKIGKKSKSTLYEYFVSKEEILSAAVRLLILNLGGYQLSRKKEAEHIVKDLYTLIEWIAGGVKHISFSLIGQIKADFPEIWEEVDMYLKGVLKELESLYVQGMEVGAFRKMPVNLLLSLDQYFVMEWISQQDNSQLSLEQMIHDYVDIRMKGILIE
ncbi:MAG: TetR/AcrR family transcriptional regulator [Bacteroidia bacterium]|nr:TetR/AcrR family transcriptional regulator [Bacteroidia bacterium]